MKRICVLTAVFAALFISSSVPATADQAPFGPVIGRALFARHAVRYPGATSTYSVGQRLADPNGVAYLDITHVCAPGMETACSANSFLGTCAKTNQTIIVDGTDFYEVITSVNCTNSHYGDCRSVEGVFLTSTVRQATEIDAVSGCQY